MSAHVSPPPRMPMFTRDWVEKYTKDGLTADIGRYTYGRPEILFRPADRGRYVLKIGHFCSIAKNVTIHVGSYGRHTIDFLSTYPMTMIFGHPIHAEKSKSEQENLDVKIGSDVWLGEGATILPGAEIGHGAVVGAGAYVIHSLEPYTINVGAPARTIKKRFNDKIIQRLLALQWWNWPDDVLMANIELFCSADIDRALDKLEHIILR